MFSAEASQLEERFNWKASRITSGTAYSWEGRISLCWCRPGWELGYFPCCRPGLKTWNSRVVYLDLSRGKNVNEFADLKTTEEKPNIVWSGRKHLETHEYFDEPLDQVKT